MSEILFDKKGKLAIEDDVFNVLSGIKPSKEKALSSTKSTSSSINNDDSKVDDKDNNMSFNLGANNFDNKQEDNKAISSFVLSEKDMMMVHAWHHFTIENEDLKQVPPEAHDDLNKLNKSSEDYRDQYRQSVLDIINNPERNYQHASTIENTKVSRADEDAYCGLKEGVETVKKSYRIGHLKENDIYLNLAIDKKSNKTYISEKSLEAIKEHGLTLSIKLPGKSEQDHEYLEFIDGKLLIIDKGPGKESLIGGKEELNEMASSFDSQKDLDKEIVEERKPEVEVKRLSKRDLSKLKLRSSDNQDELSVSHVRTGDMVKPSFTPSPPRGNNSKKDRPGNGR